jgi:hypothetical protein
MRPIQAVLSCLTALLAMPNGLAQPAPLEGISPTDWQSVELWIAERLPQAVILSAGLFSLPPATRDRVPQSDRPQSLDELLTRVDAQGREQAVGVMVQLPGGALRTLRFRRMGGELVPENPLIDP